jgi:hypothetical protein
MTHDAPPVDLQEPEHVDSLRNVLHNPRIAGAIGAQRFALLEKQLTLMGAQHPTVGPGAHPTLV